MKYVILSLIAVLTFGCGKLSNDKDKDKGDDSKGVGAQNVIIQEKGKTIGYFLGFANPDNSTFRYYPSSSTSLAFIALSEDGSIVEVDLQTGEYYSDRVSYLGDASCNGQAYSLGNVVKNQIIFVNGQYFKSDGVSRTLTPTSCKDKTGCYITDGCSVTQISGLPLSVVSRPYDFTKIAPITLTVEK